MKEFIVACEGISPLGELLKAEVAVEAKSEKEAKQKAIDAHPLNLKEGTSLKITSVTEGNWKGDPKEDEQE